MTSTFTLDDLPELIDDCYDGPHDRETVKDAARAITRLVRYLNNATQPSKPYTLDWANTTDSVLSNLGAAMHGLDQLFDQLAAGMQRQADDSTLYDDRRDRPGADTARAAAARLQDARKGAADLAEVLDEARADTVHLGNN